MLMSGFRISHRKKCWLYLAAAFFPLILFLISLSLGTVSVTPAQVLKVFISKISGSNPEVLPENITNIVWNIRLPRLLLALLAGAAFSVSGASLQSIFRNPLVNEYVLGVSFGSGFGAAVSLVLLGRLFPPQVLAFGCGLLAVSLVLMLAEGARNTTLSVLLTGIVVSAFFQALLSAVEFVASPYALQALFFWLLGSFSQVTWNDLFWSAPLVIAGLFLMIKMSWRVNVLSLNEDEARALGLSVKRERMLIICLATLITSAVVSVAGIIGWVGLIVPHAVRGVAGADNRLVIPLSAGFGAGLMILADDLIRVFSPYELPAGIITSLVGIPFFLYLIKRTRHSWS